MKEEGGLVMAARCDTRGHFQRGHDQGGLTARHALLDGIAEIALRRHQLRVRESRYASEDARPSELFRIA